MNGAPIDYFAHSIQNAPNFYPPQPFQTVSGQLQYGHVTPNSYLSSSPSHFWYVNPQFINNVQPQPQQNYQNTTTSFNQWKQPNDPIVFQQLEKAQQTSSNQSGLSGEEKAKRMMKSMGYVEGKGLGKDLQGISSFKSPRNQQSPRDHSGLEWKSMVKSYQCNLCPYPDAILSSLESVESHLKCEQHKQREENSPSATDNMFTCIRCRKNFQNFLNLKNHVETFHEPKRSTPQPAPKTQPAPKVPSAPKIQTLPAAPTKPNNNQTTYQGYCDLCNKHFSDKEIERLHMTAPKHKAKLEESKPVDKTTIITKDFKLIITQPTDPTSNYTHECHLCDVKMRGILQFKEHIESSQHRSKGYSYYVHMKWYCQPCSQSFTSDNIFQEHVRGKRHAKNLRKLEAPPAKPSVKKSRAPKQKTTIQKHAKPPPGAIPHPPALPGPPLPTPTTTVQNSNITNTSSCTMPWIDLNTDLDPDLSLFMRGSFDLPPPLEDIHPLNSTTQQRHEPVLPLLESQVPTATAHNDDYKYCSVCDKSFSSLSNRWQHDHSKKHLQRTAQQPNKKMKIEK